MAVQSDTRIDRAERQHTYFGYPVIPASLTSTGIFALFTQPWTSLAPLDRSEAEQQWSLTIDPAASMWALPTDAPVLTTISTTAG